MTIDSHSRISDLTLILVLKDRQAFTQRWLDYYVRFNPQLNVIIADGSQRRFVPECQIEKLPKNIRYFYDGPDSDIETMIRKIKKSISMVESEFTILACNDDFYLLKGLAEAVDFLQKNEEWHASAGIVRDFSILNSQGVPDNTFGKVRFGDVLYRSSSISGRHSIERIKQFLSFDESFWHAVFRTQTLYRVYCEALRWQIKDMVLYELFTNLKSVELGKLHRNDKSLFMLHQVHSQMEAYKLKRLEEQNQKWKDQLNIILKSLFQANDINEAAPTYDDILLIHQKNTNQVSTSKLRPNIEKLKYKYAHSRTIDILNQLDPFTAGVYRNQEVRNILKFLNK